MGLRSKVALVTGSGEGIGRRAILTFAEEGAHVIVNDIIVSKAEHVGDEANLIVFLATDRARHMTGEAISVNGGYAMV